MFHSKFNAKATFLTAMACMFVSAISMATAANTDTVVYNTGQAYPDYGIFVKGKKDELKKVATPTSEFSDIGRFKTDPKGKFVLYCADQNADGAPEVYKSDIKSSSVLDVGGSLPTDSWIYHLEIDSKGKNALFLVEDDSYELSDLYLLDLKTNLASKISSSVPSESIEIETYSVKFNSTGKGLVYNLYGFNYDTEETIDELYYYDIKTKKNVKVAAVAPQAGGAIYDIEFANSGKSILFSGDLNGDGAEELSLYDIKSGESKIVKQAGAGGEFYIDDIDAKGANVLVRHNAQDDFLEYLYAVKSNELTPLTPAGQYIGGAVIDPKGKTAVVELFNNSGSALVAIDLKKETSSTLTPVLSNERYISGFDFDLKGTSIIYNANQDDQNRLELYRKVLKSGELSKINDTITEGTGIYSCSVSKTGQAIYYVAAKTANYTWELYKKDLKSGETTKVNHSLGEEGEVWDFEVAGGKTMEF